MIVITSFYSCYSILRLKWNFYLILERIATVCDYEGRFDSTIVYVLFYICGHHGFPCMCLTN